MSDAVDRLRERRERVWSDLEELTIRASEENRAFTPEEQAKYDGQMEEVDRLDQRMKSMQDGAERALEAERRFARIGDVQRPGQRRLSANLSDIGELGEDIRRALRDKSPKPIEIWPAQGQRRSWYQPGIELRALRYGTEAGLGLEQRVLTKGTATQALPVNVYDHIIMHLVENSAVMAAGATVINTDTGENFQVPRSSAFVSSALTTEGGAISLSDPTLGIATLGAFGYKNLFQISRELAADSDSNILGFLGQQVGQSLALAYGPHLVTGTGSGQPQGIVTAAGTGVTGPVGTTVSLGAQTTAGMGTDLLYSLIGAVAEPYARQPAAGFLMTNASLQIARKLKDSTGQPVASATLSGGATGLAAGVPSPNGLVGYPVHIDPNVAQMAANAKSIVFGDVSRYFVRIAGGIRFERSDDYAFGSDLVTFRAVIRLDGQMVDANGVKLFVNSAT